MAEQDISIAETVAYLDQLADRQVRDGTQAVERLHFPSDRQVKLLRGAAKVTRMMSTWESSSPVKQNRIIRARDLLAAYLTTCWDQEKTSVRRGAWLLVRHDEFEVLQAAAGYLVEYDDRRAEENKRPKSANRGGRRGR